MYISSTAGGNLAVLNRRPETSPSALARFLPTPTTPFAHEASKFRAQTGHCLLRWHPKQTQATVTQRAPFGRCDWNMRGRASMLSAGDSLLLLIRRQSSRGYLGSINQRWKRWPSRCRCRWATKSQRWVCPFLDMPRHPLDETAGKGSPVAPPWPWPPAPRFGVRRSALAKPRPIAGEATGEPASHPFDGGAKACCHPLQEHSQAWASLLPQVDDLPTAARLEFGVWSGHPTREVPQSPSPAS